MLTPATWWLTGGIGLFVSVILVQLALGADPSVLGLSVISIVSGLSPLIVCGRDLYTCFAALFCFRYTGGALVAKTLYGQPVDSHLHEPLQTYLLVTGLVLMATAIALLARRSDRGSTIFPVLPDSRRLRAVGAAAYLTGAGAGLAVGLLMTRDGDIANTGPAFILASSLMNLMFLGYAAEAYHRAEASERESLVSFRLLGMLGGAIGLALFLNVRSVAVNAVLCVFLTGFLLDALRLRHLVVGIAAVFAFASYVSPLALELRSLRDGRSAAEFAAEVIDLAARTVVEPELIEDLRLKEAFRSQYESGQPQYDYFGDGSNILNRLAFVALLDAVLVQTRPSDPIGTRALSDEVLPRIAPSFLAHKQPRTYGYGDWLSWQTGLAEPGRVSFLSFPLPMEGVSAVRPARRRDGLARGHPAAHALPPGTDRLVSSHERCQRILIQRLSLGAHRGCERYLPGHADPNRTCHGPHRLVSVLGLVAAEWSLGGSAPVKGARRTMTNGDASERLFLSRFRPEVTAGGFPHDSGSLDFYGRINALLDPRMTVLDLGAGRGANLDVIGDAFPHDLARLRGRVAQLVGVDIDRAILANRHLDAAYVAEPGQPLPFADSSFDLIYSDWVLEHVPDPVTLTREVRRLLKPNGWFCARTPGKWGYIALAARLLPTEIHRRVLRHVQEDRRAEDVFPKFYRLNTLLAVAQAFPSSGFLHASYMHNPTPAYHGNRPDLFRLITLYQHLPRSIFGTSLHVFVKKRA